VSSLLPVIAAILVSGLVVQLVAHKLKVPSVIFYLLIGVVLGPEVLGLGTLETFGAGLEIIVGISVAIIVFEGAFALQIERIRGASRVSLRLVTVSALVMFVGTAVAVRFFEDTNWEIALLIGALLVATGPTVITPILNVVRVRDHVATALETEGIVNDVTAAIAFLYAGVGGESGFRQPLVRGVQIGESRLRNLETRFSCEPRFAVDFVSHTDRKEAVEAVREGKWDRLSHRSLFDVIQLAHNAGAIDYDRLENAAKYVEHIPGEEEGSAVDKE